MAKKKEEVTVSKELGAVMEKIDKDFGPGTLINLGEKPKIKLEVIPTGSLGLDLILGVGGIPKGRIIEIYGPESSGKTTLAMHIIAEAQKKGGIAAIIDAEHAFDSAYAQNLGIDINKLYVNQPEFAEQGLEVLDRLIESGQLSVIVVDSVAALVPKSELEGEIGDSKMGLMARLMNQMLRKIVGTTSKTNTVVIFINQLRDKIGIMFGNPETTTGGNGLKFYSSIRLDVRKIAQIKDGDEVVANRVKVKVVKNKVAPPFKSTEFDIIFGKGIDKSGELLEIAVALDVIVKNGSWYAYKGDKIGQGKDAVAKLFEENPGFLKDVYKEVKSKLTI